MANILSGADFGIGFPQGGGVANNDLSTRVAMQLIGQGLQQQRQDQLLQAQQEAGIARTANQRVIAQAESIRNSKGTFEQKRAQFMQLAIDQGNAGEDTSQFMDTLDRSTTLDELNTGLTKFALGRKDEDQLIGEAELRFKAELEGGSDQFEPVFQNGAIVAQRNINTGEVIKDPRAEGATGAAGLDKFFKPVTLVNKSTGKKRLALPVGDPNTGVAKLAQIDIPEGFEISAETPQEKRAANVLAVGEKETVKKTAKGAAGRRQEAIDRGLEAADSMANINRGLELLEQVETGGVDAAALKARQLFGVEGANEAELSNRLGKAVLSQLRATFGAAFTAKEGAQLKDIEAGFGKSTEGNRRLLEQAKRVVVRAAERGIRAAERTGDKETAADIREAMEFTLSEPDQPATIRDLDAMSIEELQALRQQKLQGQ